MVLAWCSRSGLWWSPTRRGIASRRLIETMVRGAGFGRLPVSQRSHIGSIDLLMPKKTQARPVRSCGGVGRLLELLGRPVAQRRMQSAAIVVLLDEGFEVRAQVIEVLILVGVDLLSLEGFHEALA